MQVNTAMLWNALEQMNLYTRRKEELLQDLERILLQCESWSEFSGYQEIKQCVIAMEREMHMQKEMQQVLERIIQNYEQTEQKLLRLQDEGAKPVEHTKISCINVAAISRLLNQWDLIGGKE